MFDSGMQETTSKELIIEEFTYDQVLAALEVIYKGSCDINPNNAVELLEIANFYKLVSKNDIEKFSKNCINFL